MEQRLEGYVGVNAHGAPKRERDIPRTPARKAEVGADEFFRLDLRAGRIVEVEDFAEARVPAWKLTVDFGASVGKLRTSAQVRNYEREELIGRMVVGAINLGCKRIAGFESEFLVLGAITSTGTVRLLAVEEGVVPGSTIA